MKADYHVHTYYSDDSQCPMEDMVKRAIAIGLDEIAFTEHVDYGVKTDCNCDYGKYLQELREMQQRYGDHLKIRAGIEFGVQKSTILRFQQDIAAYNFDFVILSNHQVDNKEFWNYKFQEGKSQDEYQQAYYKAILDVVKLYKDYSVLGHLDMIKRYDKYGAYPNDRIMDLVEQILHYVIADGKGIEVNTSSFRYGLADLMPSGEILRLYYQMGGRVLTLGSDAHTCSDLGSHMEGGDGVREALKKIGFTQFCTFEEHMPMFHSL